MGRTNKSQEEEAAERVIETFGETFAHGSAIELIVDPSSLLFSLVFWDGTKTEITPRAEYSGKIFEPPTIAADIIRAIQCPTNVGSYGSMGQLRADICRFLEQHPGLGRESVMKLMHFSLATWFPESAAKNPSLSVVSADVYSSMLLLRLLRYTCRRSLHLGEVAMAHLGSLPLSFRPTLLLDQPQPTRQLYRLLRAVGRPEALVLQKGQLRDVSCATVTCTNEPLAEGWILDDVLHIALAPTTGDLALVDQHWIKNTGRELQGKLLEYRLRNFAKVEESVFDAPRLAFPTRNIARTLGRCVVDDPEAESRLTSLLQEQDEESQVRNSTAIASVVIEAVLFLCHQKKAGTALVGEVATLSNAIFHGRDETIELEARAVGNILRSVGLFTRRIGSAGRGLRLTTGMRGRIHELAWRHNVLSVQSQSPTERNCKDCERAKSQFGFGPRSEATCPDRECHTEVQK